MAGPYYVDIGSTSGWSTMDGLSSGACWYGTSGLQNAFNTAEAGEIVYVKGTGPVNTFYTVPFDANSGTLSNGEVVTWHDGSGVVQFTGAMATPLRMQLISGNIVTDGDVMTGASSGNTVTAHIVVGITQISINVGGTNAAGYIRFIGVNSSWAIDGTRFILDGNSATANGLIFANAADLVWLQNAEVKNLAGTTKNGFSFAATASSPVLINCCSNNNTGSGFLISNATFGIYFCCVAYNNAVCGFNSGTGSGRFFFLKIIFKHIARF